MTWIRTWPSTALPVPGTVPNAHTVTHPALTTDGRIRTRRRKHREITARQLQRDQARAARLPEGRDPKHCAPASWGKQDRRDASRLSSRHCDVSSRKRRPGSLEGDADFRKGGQQSEALRRERRWPVTWRRQEGGYGELRKRTFEVGTAVARQKETCGIVGSSWVWPGRVEKRSGRRACGGGLGPGSGESRKRCDRNRTVKRLC